VSAGQIADFFAKHEAKMREREGPAILELDAERRFTAIDTEDFDRIGFAMRALELLAPPHLTVAVCRGCIDLNIVRGRDLARGAPAGWAIVAIGRHVTRQRIALALAELVGHGQTPFVVDLLLAADSRRAAGSA
jgi:hypothetical protein